MRTYTLLDLFCGAGGASMGYFQAGFAVAGVDIVPQPHYPFPFIRDDAIHYCVRHGSRYDVIAASPPCQRYSRETPHAHKAHHPDLLEHIEPVLQATGRPYIIENVEDARRVMDHPFLLCGSMFGLPIWRHRRFVTRPRLFTLLPPCDHSFVPVLITGTQKRHGLRREYSVAQRRLAIECPWMTDKELDQAVPPAYTAWIGHHFLSLLRTGSFCLRTTDTMG